MRRHAFFNVAVIKRTRHFGGNAGKFAVQFGDFGRKANTFRSFGGMGYGGI